jgi:hypothetical protein
MHETIALCHKFWGSSKTEAILSDRHQTTHESLSSNGAFPIYMASRNQSLLSPLDRVGPVPWKWLVGASCTAPE